MSQRDVLIRNLEPYLVDLAGLLDSSRHRFSLLTAKDVPEKAGLYVIYCEEPFETFYVGKANRRKKPSLSGQPDALQFRIMKNHLGYQGDDNFFRYLKEEFQLATKNDVRTYIRNRCSVCWLEVGDPRRLLFLEHLAIAALQPRFNKG